MPAAEVVVIGGGHDGLVCARRRLALVRDAARALRTLRAADPR